MRQRSWVIEILQTIVGDKATAEMVVDRLNEEGLLHLGYGDADIDMILEAFSEAFGTTKVTRYDRYAANRIAKKYSSQAICGIIRLLAESRSQKFAPVVNSVVQLEEKLPSIINFLRDKNTEVIHI